MCNNDGALSYVKLLFLKTLNLESLIPYRYTPIIHVWFVRLTNLLEHRASWIFLLYLSKQSCARIIILLNLKIDLTQMKASMHFVGREIRREMHIGLHNAHVSINLFI